MPKFVKLEKICALIGKTAQSWSLGRKGSTMKLLTITFELQRLGLVKTSNFSRQTSSSCHLVPNIIPKITFMIEHNLGSIT